MDKIILSDLRFWAKHGVFPDEKEFLQEFRVDLAIDIDLKLAAMQDDLSLTLDYQSLYRKIKDLIETTSYDLIETLAENIAKLVLKEQIALGVVIKLEKCRAKSGEDVFTAGVVLERSK